MIPQHDTEREPHEPPARFVVRYWGVRGSVPTPGPSTVRYGGNTTCLELLCDDQRIIIDAGTGIRSLGAALRRDVTPRGHAAALLFSHFHADHVMGLPFFGPLYDPRTRLTVHADADAADAGLAGLRRVLSAPLFPVDYDTLPAQLTLAPIAPGEPFTVGPVTVRTCRLRHPGSALAFRFEHRGRAFVHASDLEHEGPAADPALVALCSGADALSYDAMFVEGPEYDGHRGWGHSTWQAGLRLAAEAHVARFVATHHAPEHDDAFMDDLAHDLATAWPGALVAAEGLELDLLSGEVRHTAPIAARGSTQDSRTTP